jgi:hypothetical protein
MTSKFERDYTAKQYRSMRKILRGNMPIQIEDHLEESPKVIFSAWMVFGTIFLAGLMLIGSCSLSHAYTLNQWADCIRITEGNPNYGILSLKTHNYRLACKLTVWNNWKRYKDNRSDLNGFVVFLANRYCPFSVDPVGNRNWKHNMIVLLRRLK